MNNKNKQLLKKSLFSLTTIMLLLFSMLSPLVSALELAPMTMYGQLSGCSSFPSETITYQRGQTIDLNKAGSLLNVYWLDSDGNYNFKDEYKEKYKSGTLAVTHVVEVYNNCNFEATNNFFRDDGKPTITGKCIDPITGEEHPDYVSDSNGNCVYKDETTRLAYIKIHCREQDKNYYDGECVDRPLTFDERTANVQESLSNADGSNAKKFLGMLVLGVIAFLLLKFIFKFPLTTIFILLLGGLAVLLLMVFLAPVLPIILAVSKLGGLFI
jgi:hypothetical protein